MADFFAARVWEAGTLTGTDPTYTLPGTAMVLTGDALYRTFAASGIAVGATFTATVAATTTGGAWEQSRWTYTAANTIQRLAFGSSSTGAAVNWSGVACAVQLDAPLPVSVSAGTLSAGQLVALGANGILDASLVPPGGLQFIGMLSSVNYYVFPTINPVVGSGTATSGPGATSRSTVPWRFAQKPLSFGVVCSGASAGGNCQIRLYEITSSNKSGALLYDSGAMSTGTGGVLMGTTISGGITLPSVFFYDLGVDSGGNGAYYIHGAAPEIGGSLDMSAGSSGVPSPARAVYYTGLQSPASNPCNYDGTINSYYYGYPPSLMAVF